MIRVCFVCLANICRSPTAEGIMLHLVEAEGLGGRIAVDSAGTAGWHEGRAADPRSRATAARNGIELPSRSRAFVVEDFEVFDYVVAMDRQNLSDLVSLAPDDAARARLSLLREHAVAPGRELDVPDPYMGAAGFDRVFAICREGCEGLLRRIRSEHGL